MKKIIASLVLVIALGAAYIFGWIGNAAPAQQEGQGNGNAGNFQGGPGGNFQGGPGGQGGQGGRGGRGGGRGPNIFTVELAKASKQQIAQQLTVVGNLVGDATVAVVPRAAGRLQEIAVRLGDQVSRGQRIAKIEDQEIQEQVRQAEAAFEVSKATIRQRDADLALAKTNVERARNLFQRQLLPQQTLDDNEARYQAAIAQLDLARAQNNQSQARLDELKINLANTNILSPVDGFVARRAVDPGAFVGQNAPIVDVVDIRRVRLVVNVVEKDLKQIKVGDTASVNVDAFPGENFSGRIARLAPILDATTRTASIELEIANPGYRLKPGMYARVNITTANKKDALVVPSNSVVDLNGRRGVFLPSQQNTATFRALRLGIEEDTRIEVLEGLEEGDAVISTGAAGLTDGGRYQIAGRGAGVGGGPNGAQGRQGAQGASGEQARNGGRQPGAGGVQGTGGGAAAAVGQPLGAADGSGTGAATGERRGRRGGGVQGGEGFRSGGDGTGVPGQGGGRRGGRRGGQQGDGQAPTGN